MTTSNIHSFIPSLLLLLKVPHLSHFSSSRNLERESSFICSHTPNMGRVHVVPQRDELWSWWLHSRDIFKEISRKMAQVYKYAKYITTCNWSPSKLIRAIMLVEYLPPQLLSAAAFISTGYTGACTVFWTIQNYKSWKLFLLLLHGSEWHSLLESMTFSILLIQIHL